MSFTLRQLRYFVGIAEEGSYGAAALRLAVSQPSLTQQMQMLQQHLGVPLFRSLGRGVVLTDVGAAFLADARQVLAAAESGAAHALALHRGLAGRVRVGCSDDFISGPHLARLLAFFAERPGLRLELHAGLSADLLLDLDRERLDLALCAAGTPRPSSIRSQVIGRADIVALMATSHHLARHDRLDPVLLRGEQLILLPPSIVSGFAARCRELLDRAGVVPSITHSAANGQMAAAMAAAGLGIALETRSSSMGIEGLAAIPLRGRRAHIELVVHKRASAVSAGTAMLWRWMTGEAQPEAR